MPIAIREVSADGQALVSWGVGWHNEYGQGGLLAYKLDTLIVNRKLDEAGRPVPRILRLGGLKEIARDLGVATHNTRVIKDALYQNASAFITAKVRYKARDGSERWIEIGGTRYTIVFTGERLPDGRTADAVYLILNDFFREILDHAQTRPLDYNYLRDLPPASQRLYELLSYQMFGALRHGSPRARMRYSEFCTYAPQTRYATYGEMRRQMAKIHAPHLRAGYITGVEYEPTTDRERRPDWMMAYTPGPKARAEYRAFTGKGGPVLLDVPPTLSQPEPELKVDPEPTGLEKDLIDRGVSRGVAVELARDVSEERIRAQIERADWLRETKPKRIKDLGAYLVEAIREDYAAPAGFEGRVERAARETAQREAIDREDEARKSTARTRAVEARIQAYWEALPSERRAALEAEALDQAAPADRAAYEAAAAPVRRLLLVGLRDALLRHRLGLPAAD
jgi:hypothetical protein